MYRACGPSESAIQHHPPPVGCMLFGASPFNTLIRALRSKDHIRSVLPLPHERFNAGKWISVITLQSQKTLIETLYTTK